MAVATNMLDLLDGNTLLETAIAELCKQLSPENVDYKTRNTPRKISLASFVETTSKLILEPWQHHLCKRLEKLTWQKGQRILIHKPPQHGGSIIVSQRLPAYLIGDNPSIRVKLAGFNIDHSKEFTKINREIMQGAEYQSIFPDPDTRIPIKCSDEQFSTKARRTFKDAQSSLKALGLLTGFVGQGAETLIIDDPYASPQAAMSKLVRESVWSFWEKGAKVRIDDDTNVVVMFHRYDEDDFVGQLIQEEGLQSQGGIWELLSYRAEWDGDERPEIGGPDPMRRKVGQYLSPRKARQKYYYSSQKRNPGVWLSQFQGKPSKADGNFFAVSKFRVIPRMPIGVGIVKICRGWDIASSEDGDWTVGVLMALGSDGYIYILDVVRIRKNTDERNKIIRATSRRDRKLYQDTVVIRMPQDPNGSGKDMTLAFKKLLIGFSPKIETVTGKGNKEQRADPYSEYVNGGLARIVYDGDIHEKDDDGKYISWVKDFIEEHRKFPGGPNTKNDQIDAAADAFSEIALEIDEPPGEDFDTLGLQQGEIILSLDEVQSEEDLFNELLGGYEYGSEEVDTSYGYKKNSLRATPGRGTRLSTSRQRQDARKATSWRFKLKRSSRNRPSRGAELVS